MPNPLSGSVWTDGGEFLKAFDITRRNLGKSSQKKKQCFSRNVLGQLQR